MTKSRLRNAFAFAIDLPFSYEASERPKAGRYEGQARTDWQSVDQNLQGISDTLPVWLASGPLGLRGAAQELNLRRETHLTVSD